ncbi:MAG: hypothetical protein KGI08_08830 [Thaumarchaeota archaeon]|nr:hypothetical protein [Nitrososphaerota archaeon]
METKFTLEICIEKQKRGIINRYKASTYVNDVYVVSFGTTWKGALNSLEYQIGKILVVQAHYDWRMF